MKQIHRRTARPILFVLLGLSLFLAACGRTLDAGDWPGVTAVDNVVYVANASSVTAVDIDSRQELWQFPEEQNNLLFFFAPPASDGAGDLVIGDYGASRGFFSPGVVVTVYGLGDTLDSGLPEQRWSNDAALTDRLIAPPLLDGDRVYMGSADNHVVALDAATGEVLWDFETQQSIWAQPQLVDGVLYIASLDHFVYALDADDGSVLWTTELPGAVPSAPTIGTDLVYAGGYDSAMHGFDRETGEEVWSFPAENWIWGSAVLFEEALFFADANGNVFALEAATGDEIWRVTAAGPVRATPVLKDGILYVPSVSTTEPQSTPGQLMAVDISDGSVIWERETPAPIFSTPVVVGDQLIAGVSEYDAVLLIIDLNDGSVAWEFTPSSN